MKPRNSYIGAAIPRREDLRFLRGSGEFVGDIVRPKMLHAAVLRNPVAHGRIARIDTNGARSRAGVRAIFTAADIPAPMPRIPLRQEASADLARFEQGVIAADRVRYVGEPVALVVAESAEAAEDALSAIVLDIDPRPAVVSAQAALRNETVLFESAGTNLATAFSAVRGDADAAFAAHKAYRRREQFKVHRHTAVALEPRGLLAEWDAASGQLTVSGAAKVPFANRRILARHLGIPEAAIRLVENDVGGAFGTRGEYYPEDFLIPFAAYRLGCPIRWLEDRRENLVATNHAREAEIDLEIACDPDGIIVAMRGTGLVDIGAYIRTVGATQARNIAQVLSGPYRIPHIEIDISLVVTNKTPSGTYRGPGRFEADFFRERLFDMAATDLGVDRVEFRRRNLIAVSEMPYRLATVAPLNVESETDSGDYAATLDKCLSEFGWDEKRSLNGRLIDGRHNGIAVGCYIEGGASGPKETARLEINPDGSVSVFAGSSAVGQGLETVFAQIAADALELPLSRIAGVFHGSTDLVSEGFGSYSSRATVMGGSAILAAANILNDAVRTAAAERLQCAATEIRMAEGQAVGPDGSSIPFSDFAGISAEGVHSSNRRTYSYGAHAAHVSIDAATGHVAVLDYVAVEDVGRIINPVTLHGQTLGAIVQGLGGTLLEQLVYDENGQLLTTSLADYLMPTAGEFQRISVLAFENAPSPTNPLGAKGAGEGGIIPVGGVIANAVAAALYEFGVEPNTLPLSPPRLWTMIENGRR